MNLKKIPFAIYLFIYIVAFSNILSSFIHCIIKLSSQMRRSLVVSLRYLIVCSYQTIETLRCHSPRIPFIWCLLAVVVIVIVLIIIIWFENCSNDCSCYTIWLTILNSERLKMQSHPADESHTYIQLSIKIYLRKPAESSRNMPISSAVSTI